jgi:hypothetical protein
LINVRLHDLRHTFGQRLRATGASLEVRQDLLGYKSGRIATEYCAAQIRELLDIVEKICDVLSCKNPAISILNQGPREESSQSIEWKRKYWW